ncbi:MAG: hypothetical protein HBSAPP03_07460 [Phycisphaerae bacterium]|nr:MAG: hypothetical protein HBSAPP03_07460 [Phycisphaerae bacterium]
MARWITIILSVVGLAVGVYAVSTADTPPVSLPLARPAAVNPYARGVSALGLVEPTGRDVGVVAPEPGLVVGVHAGVGDRVKKGDALFELDSRALRAELLRAEAAVALAQAEIDRWHALPRTEDVPPLEAAVARARALLKDREENLKATQDAAARGGGNEREVSSATFAVEAARAEAARAEADLAKVKAGGWRPDLAVAEAALAQRRAEVEALKVLMDRLVVRSPRDGVVLRREIEAGEYAGTDRRTPAMIVGDLAKLSVRAQVDEEDIALVTARSRAVARTRGAASAEVRLKLTRIEPYARPKRDLAGDNLERVDTRVIDVVFEVEGEVATPLYPGQAVDVFIEATAGEGMTGATKPS